MQEAIQFLMIGLKVNLASYRIEQLGIRKLTQKVLVRIQYFKSASKGLKEIK